jgi:hypothetical protein
MLAYMYHAGQAGSRVAGGTRSGMRRLVGPAIAGALFIVAAVIVLAIIFWHRWSWGGVPDWVNATASVGLLAGAFFTAVFAVQAFHEQSREVRLLENQVEDQREMTQKQLEVLSLQAEEIRISLENRRREQATRVFTWVEVVSATRGRFQVHVTNESDRPVYDMSFALGSHEDEAYSSPPQAMKHLMPHETAVFEPDAHDHSILWGTSWEAVQFRDAAGATWRVNSRGQVTSAGD